MVLFSLNILAFGQGKCPKTFLDGGGMAWLGRFCFVGRWGAVRLNRGTVPGTRWVYFFSGYVYSCSPALSCHPYFRAENVRFRHPNLE